MNLFYDIVVSAENSLYMGWQTQAFCWSALRMLGKRPIIVVHRSRRALRPEFIALQERGFSVIEAPSFSCTPRGYVYPPRNEIGTLIHLADMNCFGTDYVLLCEPDMLFVRPPEYAPEMSADAYSYLNYDQPRVRAVIGAVGLQSLSSEEWSTQFNIGAPYMLPVRLLRLLATNWLKVLDLFDPPQWIDMMYAFGIACAIEGWKPAATNVAVDNLNPLGGVTRSMIHYCYGDDVWNKRHYKLRRPLDPGTAPMNGAEPGTILREILNQLCAAAEYFYSDAVAPESDDCRHIIRSTQST